jgi:uncharacterized protein YjlB
MTFSANGWGRLWRNGTDLYVHYHAVVHDTMGIAGAALPWIPNVPLPASDSVFGPKGPLLTLWRA